MKNLTLQATCTTTVTTPDGEEHTLISVIDFDENTTFGEIKEQASEAMTEEWAEEHATPINIAEGDIEVEITDFDEVPDSYHGTKDDEYSDLFTFLEAVQECDQDAEVIEAALYLGISPRDIDEAYQGEYRSDEAFAQEIAEQLGAIDQKAQWPQTCIDWEYAARELMYDYCEHEGHYFRNL